MFGRIIDYQLKAKRSDIRLSRDSICGDPLVCGTPQLTDQTLQVIARSKS